jgi:hypothetical protein
LEHRASGLSEAEKQPKGCSDSRVRLKRERSSEGYAEIQTKHGGILHETGAASQAGLDTEERAGRRPIC